MMDKKIGVDLTKGSIPKGLLKLVVPMLLANWLNAGYNIVDSIWIGKIVGPIGLAATAVTFPIYIILLSVAAGITVSSNILIGQYYGAKDVKSMVHISRVATTLATTLSIILVIVAYSSLESVLLLLNTPLDVLPSALSYFKIIILGFPFLFYYYLVASFLYGTGDTVRPLIFLSISAILNIILDPLLIMGIGPFPELGLEGAAIATVFSQFVSVVISLTYLKLKKSVLRANPLRIVFDFRTMKKMFTIGLPSSTTQLVGSFSFMVLTSLVNQFGSTASASMGIALRIDSLTFMSIMALSTGIATMSAQNIGANRMDRIKDIHKTGVRIAIAVSSMFAIIAIAFSEPIIRMFTDDPSVISNTKDYIYINMPSLIALSVAFATNGIINGAGKTLAITLITFISLIVVRSPLAYFFVEHFGLIGVWMAMGASCFVGMTLSLTYYYSNKWKKNANIAVNEA